MARYATGVVVGSTAVIEDDVSILHAVTLGGTGKQGADRHPKIRRGVMIGAGAKILGNIEVGACARVAVADQARRSARTAFRPPKAKALDRTAPTLASRAVFGTTSSAHSGSGSW